MFLIIKQAIAAIKRPIGVASTSRAAFDGLMTRDELTDKCKEVLEAIESIGQGTNEQIADFLGWRLNCVTGRVTELHKMGFAEVAGIGRSKAGNSSKIWRSAHPNDANLRKIV